MELPQLVHILTKIANRLTWDDWDLTEHEYDVLELATGEQIADVAYHKRLNLSRLIKNADAMVEEHNERQEKRIVRELKNLKLDLLTDLPRERKVQTPLPDPEEVERRLLLETIDEIAGLDPVIIEVDAIENEINDQDEPIFDVIERMKANFKGFTGFKDKIVEDPSLQRDCIEDVSNFPGPSSISMPEVIPADLDLNNLNREDAFGEATAEDIADAGLFAGPLGRPLYEGLKNRETMADISRRAAQSMTPLNQEMPEIFINDFPQLPNPRRTTLGVPVPQVELTDHSLLNELPAAYPDVFVEDGPPQPQAAVIDQTVSPPRDSKRMSRREYFEDAVNVIEGKMMGKPTKRRRRRRLRRSPSLEDLEFLELNGLLVRHNRKQKVTRASTPKIQPSITMDIFENLEDYESDEIFDDEVEEIQMETEQEIRSVLPPLLEDELFVVPETLQHQPMTPTAEVLLIPKSNNSESFVPKRRRVDRLETDELREIIGFDDNLAPPLPAPRQLTAQLETPLAAFKPPKVSTVRGDGIQKITLDDIEFGRLRNVSASNLQGNHSLDAGTIASYLGRSKSAIGDAVATAHGAAGASSNAHRQPDDSLELRRYVKDGENWIAYEGHGGRIEHYTEYNLETVALYFQVRILMRERNCWKLKLADIIDELELLKNNEPKFIELRLLLIAELNLIKLTLSEDEEHIIDIEIPIKNLNQYSN